jgi:hypothetical protein
MNAIKLWIVFIVVISSVIIAKMDLATNNKKIDSISNSCVTEARSSVTFIMGADEPNSNNFYRNTTYYYHMHPEDKTDVVTHSCKTLKDILDYLSNPLESKSYGTINIVCHGNPWQGLSMSIATDLPRASLPNLQSALKSKWITPLCTNSIDHHSRINVISCGVGQNNELVEILKEIFSCPESGSLPVLNIEKYYVNFTDKLDKKRSEFYFVATKYDFSDPNTISGKLKYKYKNTPINWQKAYRNESKNSEDAPYKYRFRMLVEWKIGFKDLKDIPVLKKEADILKWLKTQNTAMDELKQMQLQPEDFMWHSFLISDQHNTLKIKGYGNVEGVMVDLKSDDISQDIAILH